MYITYTTELLLIGFPFDINMHSVPDGGLHLKDSLYVQWPHRSLNLLTESSDTGFSAVWVL